MTNLFWLEKRDEIVRRGTAVTPLGQK